MRLLLSKLSATFFFLAWCAGQGLRSMARVLWSVYVASVRAIWSVR